MARNGVIGRDGGLPWRLPADLKRFKSVTMGHPLVMGRKTHDSIGRALPGRTNIVVTRDTGYKAAGCLVAYSLPEALRLAGDVEEIFVIGGAALYESLLATARRIYLTLIHGDYAGDVTFPEIDPRDWRVAQREDIDAGPDFPHAYSFILMEREPAGLVGRHDDSFSGEPL